MDTDKLMKDVQRAILDAIVRYNADMAGRPYHPDDWDELDSQMAYEHARAALAVALPWCAGEASDALMSTLACSICGEVDHCRCNFDVAVSAGPCQPSTDKQVLAIRALAKLKGSQDGR